MRSIRIARLRRSTDRSERRLKIRAAASMRVSQAWMSRSRLRMAGNSQIWPNQGIGKADGF
jgi:hypothetical protein